MDTADDQYEDIFEATGNTMQALTPLSDGLKWLSTYKTQIQIAIALCFAGYYGYRYLIVGDPYSMSNNKWTMIKHLVKAIIFIIILQTSGKKIKK